MQLPFASQVPATYENEVDASRARGGPWMWSFVIRAVSVRPVVRLAQVIVVGAVAAA